MTEEEILTVFFDATEQEIYRPKQKQLRRQYYSAKRKCHTIKPPVVVRNEGKIKAVSKFHPGSVHDKRESTRGNE